MRKKFTLLITVTALLIGGSGGMVWGQNQGSNASPPTTSDRVYQGTGNNDHGTLTIPGIGTLGWDNNFGAGESGTLLPTHSITQANGKITIGEPFNSWGNVVAYLSNVADVTETSFCSCGSSTHKVVAPTGPRTIPSADGDNEVGSSFTTPYTTATHIKVDGSSEASQTPWQLNQFYFLDVEWRYLNYVLAADATTSHNHGFSGISGCCGALCSSCTGNNHQRVYYTSQEMHGNYVNGIITLEAGSHVRLDGNANSPISIGAGTHNNSKATVNLPATHYTLMNDKNLDAQSITDGAGGNFANLSTLGVEAVLGIQGNFIPGAGGAAAADKIQTNEDGSTILIGPNTTGQNAMFVMETKNTTADQVGKHFHFTVNATNDTVYTGSYYYLNASNFGNYGRNDVRVDNAATMFGDVVGTRGWQVFAHAGKGYPDLSCLSFTYDLSPLTITVNTFGSYLQSVEKVLTYNVESEFDASNTSGIVGGHVTLRAGNVQINRGHTYAGSGTGDYWVQAMGGGTTTGTKFCGDGQIVTNAGTAPVYAHNIAAVTGGHLEWNAASNIITGSQVKFENDYSSNIDWIAGNDIRTNDTITFTNLKAGASSTGETKWYAGRNIVTNSDIAALTPENGVTFTHNGSGLTQWWANTGDIHTQNIINFERTASSSGKTRWFAWKNIFTDKNVTFISRGADNDSIYWRAHTENIETGHQSGGGRIDFQNLHASAKKSHTTWHANNNIITHDGSHVHFYNNTASSNTLWLTDNQNIETYDSVTFINEKQGNTDWRAAHSILTYDTVEFTNHGSGYTKWDAIAGNISTNRPSSATHPWTNDNGFVTFNNDSIAVTEWEANLNIYTNNVVAFNNTIVNTTIPNTFSGYIKWWAQGGNIELNDSTIFNQLPIVPASYGTLRGVDHLAGIGQTSQNLIPATSLWLIARDSILSERKSTPLNSPSGRNEEPLLINFNNNNDAPIMLHAVTGDVKLDGVLHIDRQNAGTSETTIEAGQDIHFLDTTTLFDPSDADILLHAHRDILTNREDCNSDKTAPVTFEVTSSALTRWIADRNIHTGDSVNFKYNNTIETVRDLHLVAQGGNIKTERWFNIDYDSDNRILFSAVDDIHAYGFTDTPFGGQATVNVNNTGTNVRNTLNGNIWFNDSMKITRTNSGLVTAGTTDILAKYNIRTAMVDYTDHNSINNNTTIESYMGDIFLGYSTMPYDCSNPSPSSSAVGTPPVFDYDTTVFTYKVLNPAHNGLLDIKAGYEDAVDNGNRTEGGNIYFSHTDHFAAKGATSETKITIPFSNEYLCGTDAKLRHLGKLSEEQAGRMHYEHAGIIGGVGPCGIDTLFSNYAPMQGPRFNAARDTSLIYFGNDGRLLVDAGTRGNIIINRGAYLNFQDDKGNTEFRTRFGNIDMRYPFNADSLRGSLLFLASSDLPDKLNVTNCECDEERNNIYLQDFEYKAVQNSGSVFVGADNNIKLQYGGLKTIGTGRDPFFSPNFDKGYPCGETFHCDADTSENQARDLILNFYRDAANVNIGSGGFAAVASDRIDTYKNMIYNGGSGSGMSSVPGYGSLHGEGVAGYGLYIKTQANKKNWNKSDHDINNTLKPTEGAACEDDDCETSTTGISFLHQTARVTFHADARIYAENQKVLLSSPVLETFGNADYNTHLRSGGKTSITLQADSLIYHDSLIIDGPKTYFTTWSGLYRDMPVIRLGHQRFTPPTAEDGGYCAPCYTHPSDPRSRGTKALDTVFVTFRNNATVDRLHTLVAEHAVISFLTDSFDHKKGNPTLNAKFYADTFKIRNHVQMFNTADRTHDGHFELVSETQMNTKDYAGIYSRHLHMEPIAPSCSDFRFSQFWMQDYALDVITSSTFGGFGWLHADVHVENDANLFPGFASLGTDGNCYEQRAGVLKMQDLRLDKGANVKVTVGESDAANSFAEVYECDQTFESIELGRYADCLIVDSLSIYSSMEIDVAVRSAIYLSEGESRCYPIIQYKSVNDGVVNNLKLKKDKFTSKDHHSIEGTYYLTLDVDTACNVVYLCIATIPDPVVRRAVTIPSVPGITTTPVPGKHYITSGSGFSFKAKFGPEYAREGEQLAVRTGRIIDGKEEIIIGKKNANGEYEYFIPQVRVDIVLTFGPDYVSADDVEGSMVWSHSNMINIRVDKDDIASIYMVTGQIVHQLSIPEGTTSVPMERGVYIVTLKDGSVHKVIVK